MSELDVQLKHSLDRLVRLATDAPLDWDDVGHRARSGRTRLSILAGAALVCLMVGVAAGFGVGPGLWRLVAGTPVSPDRLSSEEKQMFASMSSRGDPVTRIMRLEGFAADAVTKVGLLDANGKLVAPVPVIDNTYLRSTGLPTGELQAIVAYDHAGKRVYCRDMRRGSFTADRKASGPCGGQAISPAPEKHAAPPPAWKPPSTKLGKHLQRGSSRGVTVDVYEPGTAIFDLEGIDPEGRRLLTGPNGLLLACLRARFYQGRWLADEYSTGASFGRQLRWDLGRPLNGDPFPHQLPPPYDGCEIGGLYGHRWNDAFGTRNVVEIPLTAEGRHFFNDRATARDLAYFVRSGRVHGIRLSADPRAGLEAFVHSFPKRVVELSSPGARAPEHLIGFWIGDRTIVFTATSSTGRRLFVVANRGTLKLPEKNLGDLAFVF